MNHIYNIVDLRLIQELVKSFDQMKCNYHFTIFSNSTDKNVEIVKLNVMTRIQTPVPPPCM